MLILWLQSCFAKQSPKTSGFFLWIDWLIDGHTCLHFPSRLFSSWGEQGLLSSYGVWAWVLWFLGCRARAQQWWCMWNHLERRLTHVSCIGRLVLYHWATREALECQSLMFPFKFHLVFNTGADIILDPLNMSLRKNAVVICCFVAKSCRTLLQPWVLEPTMLLCPWNYSGRNTGVSCHFLLKGIFPTQGSNTLCLLYW